MGAKRTIDAAKGKWWGILLEFGLPEAALSGRHGPCPLCGGKDRFRWDDKGGAGAFICSQCGAGDGMALAMRVSGMSFAETAARIDRLLDGGVSVTPPVRRRLSAQAATYAMREVMAASAPAAPGDLVDAYLSERGLDEIAYPASIRCAARLRDGDGGLRPAMVAEVRGPDGAPVTLHRTFLRADGRAKAEMMASRKLMPLGDGRAMPDGACVRLTPSWLSGALGIAEGIETSMAAANLYDMPVWAGMNAAMLERWIPPTGCTEIVVFGDNDASFTGHAAAYGLARRLKARGCDVTVVLPAEAGTDFADVHFARVQENLARELHRVHAA